jgi:hypothetical protein
MGTAPFSNARRVERRPQKVGLTLIGKTQGVEFQQPAHTVDVSSQGLGILTDGPVEPSCPLSPGQIVCVYGVGSFRLGYCRIVWVRADNRNTPSRAGLEFMN